MATTHQRSLAQIWVRLEQAIRTHVADEDVEEFLDAVTTIAGQHDTHGGHGAGNAYVEQVIRSLTGGHQDDLTED
jgi:hypothetical protein